jgi:cysteine desulfurase
MSELIYLDNNATTLVADEVLEAMEPYYREWFGNAHSAYSLGRRSHDAVEAARAEVAMLLGTAPAEVIFTSCGTEGNAIVIRGLADTAKQRRKMVTTAVEHPSVMLLLRALEAAGQIDLAVIPVSDEGAIDLDDVRNAVDDKTLLVSVMLAQNETGVILPVAGIAAIAHQRGALVHVDAVQSAAKIAVDANALGTDFITISGHKFHAPKGVGALTIRRGIRLPPLWYGGGQELGMRSGTEPVPSLSLRAWRGSGSTNSNESALCATDWSRHFSPRSKKSRSTADRSHVCPIRAASPSTTSPPTSCSAHLMRKASAPPQAPHATPAKSNRALRFAP